MLLSLPYDVEGIIYDYLIKPEDVDALSHVSKYIKTRIRNVKYIKEKTLLHERTRKLLEDGDSYKYMDDDLGNIWEQYHLVNWPEFKADPEYDATPLWTVGSYVDAKDKISVWGNAKIIKLHFEERPCPPNTKRYRIYTVQFLGWSDNFNEEITADKIARFGEKTMNPCNKFESIKGDDKKWVLYYSGGIWTMLWLYIDTFRSNDESLFAVMQQGSTKITKENINNLFRTVTDATVFLSTPDRKFKPITRTLTF